MSSCFSLLFDESLNHGLQEEQMGVHVRFWNDSAGEVQTRYLDSRFFKRPNVDNITDEILKVLESLPTEKMTMLSMDSPNTNWKVLENMKKVETRKNYHNYLMWVVVASHVIHRAFQTGVNAAGCWELEKVFKAMWRLFNDSPARRDLYIRLSTSNLFLSMFCGIR